MVMGMTLNVYAASYIKINKDNLKVGDTFEVEVSFSQIAAWNVHLNATGPVENCLINEADVTEDTLDTDKKFTASCKATGTGTIELKLSGDVTQDSTGKTTTLSDSLSIKVGSGEREPIDTGVEIPIIVISGLLIGGFLTFKFTKKKNAFN